MNAILIIAVALFSASALEAQEPLDPVARQNELLDQRLRLASQERSLMRLASPAADRSTVPYAAAEPKNSSPIESIRSAFASLVALAPDIAKSLACTGKNIVISGPAKSEPISSLTAFDDLLGLLQARLRATLEIQPPVAPDKEGSSGVYGVASLSGPALRSVLDLIASFRPGSREVPETSAGPWGDLAPELYRDEQALVAAVAGAAAAQGCQVYWPSQHTADSFRADSPILAKIQALAELNDSTGHASKLNGLQQKIQSARLEAARAQGMIEARQQAIEKLERRRSEASAKVDSIRTQIAFLSSHIKDQKNAALQDKLNRAFDRSWDELDHAVRLQLSSRLPATMEEQGKLGEMSKRLDLLKARTDWLSQYVKDEKDLALQDKLKRTLSSNWDQLDAALKDLQNVTAATPQGIEPEDREKRRWVWYLSELKEYIGTLTAVSEAYTTFRGALLDGSAGSAPLTRLIRAEVLRNLLFDEKMQQRAGASVVQLKLQHLGGSQITKMGSEEKRTYSGGVVLSFFQYEPGGRMINSGVQIAYSPFK
jgi:hypothetical protein